jgi:hypothetical protein
MDAIQLAKDIGTILSQFIVPLIGYGAYVLRDIRQDLRRLSDATIRHNEWREMHEKETHPRLDGEIARLRDRTNGMRRNIMGED